MIPVRNNKHTSNTFVSMLLYYGLDCGPKSKLNGANGEEDAGQMVRIKYTQRPLKTTRLSWGSPVLGCVLRLDQD